MIIAKPMITASYIKLSSEYLCQNKIKFRKKITLCKTSCKR